MAPGTGTDIQVLSDTASMVYMPLLEETGHRPSEKYAHGPELYAHCKRIGEHYDFMTMRYSIPKWSRSPGTRTAALGDSNRPG